MRRFGELETAVMDVLWAFDGPATVREVRDQLRRDRPPAYTTVMTVMDNLHRKALLTRQRDGRAYRYQPTDSREEYDAALMAEVLESSGDREATLLSFVDKITPGELAQLRRMLDEPPGEAP